MWCDDVKKLEGKLKYAVSLVALLVALGSTSARAEVDSQAPSTGLSYGFRIDPEGRQIHVRGKVAGLPRAKLTNFGDMGIRKPVKIAIAGADGNVTFTYRVPIGQSTFKDPFRPVLGREYCAAFARNLLVAPKIDGVAFEAISLAIEVPEGWNLVTSLGPDTDRLTLASLEDLGETLICAGDYAAYSFDLNHRDSDAITRFHVAIRGRRDWDDEAFVDDFRRMARGQMDYFGGSHPAPVQFLALHLLTEGEKPAVPGFNRRAPGHDTVMALHTPERPRQHFEFLGMLAHEHLHNWYPNAMRSDLGPWFTEGLNDYVAYRGLLASGLHSREQFSEMLSKWYREYEWCLRTENQRVMPYRRGMIAAWVFDIQLSRATGGRHGLTDVLLNLIRSEPPGGVVRREHFIATLEEVSGDDMEALYRHLVEEDGPIDLETYLVGSGFRITEKRGIEIRPETEPETKLFEAILSD